MEYEEEIKELIDHGRYELAIQLALGQGFSGQLIVRIICQSLDDKLDVAEKQEHPSEFYYPDEEWTESDIQFCDWTIQKIYREGVFNNYLVDYNNYWYGKMEVPSGYSNLESILNNINLSDIKDNPLT